MCSNINCCGSHAGPSSSLRISSSSSESDSNVQLSGSERVTDISGTRDSCCSSSFISSGWSKINSFTFIVMCRDKTFCNFASFISIEKRCWESKECLQREFTHRDLNKFEAQQSR